MNFILPFHKNALVCALLNIFHHHLRNHPSLFSFKRAALQCSDGEEVFISDPPSGDDDDVKTEDVSYTCSLHHLMRYPISTPLSILQDYEYGNDGSETEYENAREAGSSGISTPQEDVHAEATSSTSQQAPPAAPRGLPGLPLRPKGGISGLPPKSSGKTTNDGDNASDQPSSSAHPGTAAAPVLPPRPASQTSAGTVATTTTASTPEEPEKVRITRQKVQEYRINIFRAALRLRYPTRSAMLQQLMYRLNMAERIHLQSRPDASPAQAADTEGQAHADAERLEVLNQPLDFSCAVLVLGMSGVGKTATLHNLLGMEPLSGYHATESVQILRGQVAGMPVTFIDTPGLHAGPAALGSNLSKLHAAKRAWNKYKPHAVLYLDRMDIGRRDQADLPVMHAISEVFGPDIWFSTVLTLTHATAPPPDGANGQPIAADMYQQQRSQQLQQVARQVTGDQRLMNPVALVENSPSCPRAADGEPELPSGTPWRRQLLMLCFTTKVLNEANTLLKPGDVSTKARAMNPYMGMKVPPVGWLLSRLVDFRGPRKPPEDEREIKMDDEIDRLSGPERAAALRQKRMFLKQKAEESRQGESSVPMLAPEPQMGPSFDPDTSSHHFKVIEDPATILIRPIVSDSGVDHQDSVDTVHMEKQTVLRPRGQYLGGIPFLGYCQVTKDKNQFAFQSQVEGSYFHSSKWASTMETNAQTIGRDVLFTSRAESRLRTGKRNKVTVGTIASKLGEDYSHPFNNGALAYGLKIDDRLKITPNAKLRASLGRVYTRAGASVDHGTAASADFKLRPGGDPSTRVLLGSSAVWQRRDTTIAGNVATEFRLPKSTGRGGKSDTIVSANANYNNKGNGQIVTRINSHDYPQLALAMAVPIVRAAWDKIMVKEEF